ncbi:MAG: FliM/FliN family flagellar motor switch protein [Zymomonas mobilis subsp. pomaceae]|uniref:Flagellar motor switch protein FliM n=1 Tax=Zymomonas mobilis subsp. pomaceae (strain ATCC 29192 / DSM 22645 / JCM 10191 / CCUG 17912 / NBRC 13757 / NCIMB 11200 / NRRL B-4491 / Barker I) TaxID=579138 RepID=F8ERN0_ZYMMT|nr:FliM/FliN family flagellar motor switch protein [Zymomonas mobilis]AEI37488.1 flagellar motor switch protein FliM [Zymomonas mobilis subsp. pomaceae ATCC 29192]MDX5948856.1 FliM/FliN family flagellar motor switch protein [Zymomonas mobilis subsp. pomaceae]GEB88663.1 flagellar motor switch protein FliM [Zymomonas mobilis subsp. pomaceae]
MSKASSSKKDQDEATSLSGAEMDALLAELGGDTPDEDSEKEHDTFVFGQETLNPIVRMAGLERIAEKLARRLRLIIEPFARARTQVTVDGVDIHHFEKWRRDLPEFVSISLYRLAPLKGGTMIVMDPQFITGLVDAFYGGTGIVTPSRAKEFTPAEERLLARLSDTIAESVVEAWSDVVQLKAQFLSRENNGAYVTMIRNDEAVVVQRFTIVPGNGRAARISIVYPRATLRPFEMHLETKVHDDAGPADENWTKRMRLAVAGIPIPVKTILARPKITMGQLKNLKVGDIIPITLPEHLPLLAGNKKIAYGSIGDRDGKAALLIEKIEQEPEI